MASVPGPTCALVPVGSSPPAVAQEQVGNTTTTILSTFFLIKQQLTPGPCWHCLEVKQRWGWSLGLVLYVANSGLNSKQPPLKEAVNRAFTFIFTPKTVDLPVLAYLWLVVSFTFL